MGVYTGEGDEYAISIGGNLYTSDSLDSERGGLLACFDALNSCIQNLVLNGTYDPEVGEYLDCCYDLLSGGSFDPSKILERSQALSRLEEKIGRLYSREDKSHSLLWTTILAYKAHLVLP